MIVQLAVLDFVYFTLPTRMIIMIIIMIMIMTWIASRCVPVLVTFVHIQATSQNKIQASVLTASRNLKMELRQAYLNFESHRDFLIWSHELGHIIW